MSKVTKNRAPLSPIALLGSAVYLGSLLYLCLQPGHATLRLPLIGAVAAGIALIHLRHGILSPHNIGHLLLTGGLLWHLFALQADPAIAAKHMIMTGLLCLIGGMLMGRAQGRPSWLSTGMGWASVIVLWLSTRVPYGSYILLLLAAALIGLVLTATDEP